MPWSIVHNHAECPSSRPWAVVKDSDGEREGCHPTEDAAKDQLAALHASEADQELAELAADLTHVFHLPGRHNQKSHGGGGVGSNGAGRRSFKDAAESKAFLDDHYGDWRSELSDGEDQGLRFYQSPGFELMNGQLRGTDVDAPANDLKRARQATKDLRSAIDKAPPLTEAVTAHRGFSADQFGKLEPGMRITDKGFTSTSLTADVVAVGRATSPATARITLPAGTKAAAGSTRELVLAPNASFQVTSVGQRGGTTIVEMEYVS